MGRQGEDLESHTGKFILRERAKNQRIDGYGNKDYDRKVQTADGETITANSENAELARQLLNYYNSGQLKSGTFSGAVADSDRKKIGFGYNKLNKKLSLNLGGRRTQVSPYGMYDVQTNPLNDQGGYDNIPQQQYTAEQLQNLLVEGGGFLSLGADGFFAGPNDSYSGEIRNITDAERSGLPQGYQNRLIRENSYAYNTPYSEYNEEDQIAFNKQAYESSPEYARDQENKALKQKKAAERKESLEKRAALRAAKQAELAEKQAAKKAALEAARAERQAQ